MEPMKYRKNKTTELFRKLDKVVFYCSSNNYWVADNGVSGLVLKAYKYLFKVVNVAVVVFLFSEVGAFFTQPNLTDKQKSDRALMTFAHFILYSFTVSLVLHKKTVTQMLFTLGVELKKDFNDEETERQMVKKTKFYACAFFVVCSSSLISYGVSGVMAVIFSDGTFVTIITVWPEVNDKRAIAGIARVGIYIVWWLWMIRITTVYLLVLTIATSISHQYINLQLYFRSLEGIFAEKGNSQSEKEKRFERAFKVGIKWHDTTIWCTQQLQNIGGPVFSGHIIVNITVTVLLMSQLKIESDRTLTNFMSVAATVMSLLFSTGVIMWNAGDITVEAANLPTAIFLSGWHNCTNDSSYRIRRVLLIAMAQSQKPIIIKTCGFIGMSYQSYLTIVKTSYSIFSVLF